jgi:hypothetical protein
MRDRENDFSGKNTSWESIHLTKKRWGFPGSLEAGNEWSDRIESVS